MQKAFAHTAQYDSTDRGDADARFEVADGAMTRGPLPAGAAAAPCRCATVRIRIRKPRGCRRWPLPATAGARRGRCTRARSCRSRTCSTSTRRRASRSSSPSRSASSSSTRTRAASRPAARWPTPTSGRARRIRCRRSAASSGSIASLDAETAKALTSTFIEAVIAPAVADEARAILAVKQNLRVVTADFDQLARGAGTGGQADVRSFLGGMLHAGAGSRDRSAASRGLPVISPGSSRSARRRRTNGRRCASPGASARTSSRTPSSSRPPTARSRSAPGR